MASSNDTSIAFNETQTLNDFKNPTEVDNSTVILFRVVTVLFTIKMIIRTVQFFYKVGLSGAYWILQLWKHVKARRAGGKKNGTTDIRCLGGMSIGFLKFMASLLTPSTKKCRTSHSFKGSEESASTVQKKKVAGTRLTGNGFEDDPAFVHDFINGGEMPEMTVFFHLALILYCLKTIFWLIKLIIGFQYQMRRFLENRRNCRKSIREDQQHGDEEAVATMAAELEAPPVLAPCTVSLSNEARYKAAPPREDSGGIGQAILKY
ncbi:unnamed protein product [Haemonchus placei]|uniref:DUF1279 domain-containing protein n=1 Tax=Haemonchus placei TaxID=6290 RepID=A0A0N4WVJ9_HAEPC|nr:unnamed protein product [Haemonchus placei]